MQFYTDNSLEVQFVNQVLGKELNVWDMLSRKLLKPGSVVLHANACLGLDAVISLKNGASKVYVHELNSHFRKRLANLYDDSIIPANFLTGVNGKKTDSPEIIDALKIEYRKGGLAYLEKILNMLSMQGMQLLQLSIEPDDFLEIQLLLFEHFSFGSVVDFDCQTGRFDLQDIKKTPCFDGFETSGKLECVFSNDDQLVTGGEYASGYFVRRDYAALELSGACLQKVIDDYDFQSVLDIGSGAGDHSRFFLKAGKEVVSLDLGESKYFKESKLDDEVVDDYLNYCPKRQFDLIWASHVLEHQLNVNLFLKKIYRDLRDNGVLAITVPPGKSEIVGGHLTIWNAGLLVYNLVLAGFDCRHVCILSYGYNISVVLRKKEAKLPKLAYDIGDFDLLKEFLPDSFSEGMGGDIRDFNWR